MSQNIPVALFHMMKPLADSLALDVSPPTTPFHAKVFKTIEATPSPIPHNKISTSTSTKRKRKPERAESAFEPNFRGITFSFRQPGTLSPTNDGSLLTVISRQYAGSAATTPVPSRPSSRASSLLEDLGSMAFSDDESDQEYQNRPLTNSIKSSIKRSNGKKSVDKKRSSSSSSSTGRRQKSCACCGCTSTPLWRDIGKDLPLCNACGIRWKKYGVVCDVCQYVPCKQERDFKTCKRCTSALPPASKRARVTSPGVLKKGR